MIETIVIAAVTLGLTQVVKKTNKVSESYLPLVAVAIGITLSGIATMGGTDFVFNGIVYGLSAVGLYETTIDKIKGKI